jgi:DNA-binding MarR family transcriptional regulator
MPASPVPARQRATAAVLAIFKTSSWLLHEVSPVFAEHGITASRFDALEALSRHGGTARPAELRDTLHLPAQTVTSVLDQLQAAGLITRSPHPSDRRSTIAELTPAGREAIDRICPPLIDIEKDCMSALSQAEQYQLINLLAKIQERIAQRRAGPATLLPDRRAGAATEPGPAPALPG